MGSQGSPSFVSAARQGHWSEGSFSPWALLICPFLSTTGRNSFALGVTLTYCFFASPLPAARKQGDCKASPSQVSRVCAVLVDRWLMDSVGLFQWKFPTIWYWSGSFEWCFYHSFSRLIKNFLFLSGNCVSCGVVLIQVLHQSASSVALWFSCSILRTGMGFLTLACSALLDSWKCTQTSASFHLLWFVLSVAVRIIGVFLAMHYLNKGIPFWPALDLWVRMGVSLL